MTHSITRFVASSALATLALAAAMATAPAGTSAMSGAEAARESRQVRSAATEVVVYFTRGEHFAKVRRDAPDGASLQAAVEALFAGPTARERRRGLRSSLPPDADVLGISLAGDVATIEVSPAFTRGSAASLRARLAQLLHTATGLQGVRALRLAVDGVVLDELGGLKLEPPVTRDAFAPLPYGGPPPTRRTPGPRSALVRDIQERLIGLGYLPAGAADGIAGPQTAHAIFAFQGWEGLPRDGRPTTSLRTLLRRAARPVPTPGPARRIDVSLRRQVALIIERGRVVRVIHVSTGKPTSPTPPGRFRVFRKELRSWSVPFQVWLPYASYFNRGIAFHESPDVPAYAASAGCVRVPASDSSFVYGFATMGTRVIVRRS